MATELLERIHERRAHYERVVLQQFPRAFGTHDAQDIVSAAMQRAMTTHAGPRQGSEDSWFYKLLLNAARDEIRRREGRRADGGGWRHTVLVADTGDGTFDGATTSAETTPYEDVEDRLDQAPDRRQAREVAHRALAALRPDEIRLLLIRHHEKAGASREDCAEAAGLTVSAWRHQYGKAWRRFVDAVSTDEPTTRCREMRGLLGDLEAGLDDPGEAAVARGRLDAHMLECAACHAFARDSYRSLNPEWLGQGAAVLAAAGVAGAGFAAWVAGVGGVAKLALAVCAVSVTAAGVCGGLVAIIDGPEDDVRRPPPAVARATSTPSPVATPTAQPTAAATPRPRATPRPTVSPARRTTRRASQSQPAAAPSGGTGQEFDPLPSSSQSVPAPVSGGVNQEFAP